MDNQHREIKGYRELNQAEIDLMNEVKGKGIELGELVEKVKAQIAATNDEHGTPDAEHYRWAAIAKTDLQTGLMALTRAVAKPGFF